MYFAEWRKTEVVYKDDRHESIYLATERKEFYIHIEKDEEDVKIREFRELGDFISLESIFL